MKTLLKNNVSLYMFDDNDVVVLSENSVSGGSPVELIISDCNIHNSVLVDVVSAPNDWIGGKYLYKNGNWLENPSWSGESDPFAQE